jgi:hypothetical protein
MRLFASLCAMALFAPITPVHAQFIAWVSPNGSDNNSCTQTSPCATFNRVYTTVPPLPHPDQINCLGGGDYGFVAVSSSIVIDCGSDTGYINTTSNGAAITVSGGSNITVTLRHLTLNGNGFGGNGIEVTSAVSGINLVVDQCVINGFANAGGSGAGSGISFFPSGSRSSLTVSNTTITGSNSANSGYGIFVQPSTSGGILSVNLIGTVVANNARGVWLTAAPGVIAGVLLDSRVIQNQDDGIFVGGSAFVTIDGSTIADNLDIGVVSNNAGANVAFNNSTITGNGTGISGPATSSFGNNRLFLNGSNGSFASTVGLK